MNDQNKNKEVNKRCFFDNATELVGWLMIVASPLTAGLLLAAWIYFSSPSTLRLVIAIAVVIIALIIGIVFATRNWKKQGTIHFVSKVMATLELDNLDSDKKK
jgi:hypothetical protein